MTRNRRNRRVSMELSKVVLIGLAFCAIGVEGQTTVTTSGGTTNKIPLFTGSSTLGNSVITQASGNIGIGVASPTQALEVGGAAGALITAYLSDGAANATGGLSLQSPTSSNNGKNETFEWFFNEDSTHVQSRALSLDQYPSDSLGGCCHTHAILGSLQQAATTSISAVMSASARRFLRTRSMSPARSVLPPATFFPDGQPTRTCIHPRKLRRGLRRVRRRDRRPDEV